MALISGESFERIQQEVHKLLAGKIVVGHALQNDFRVSIAFLYSVLVNWNIARDRLILKM